MRSAIVENGVVVNVIVGQIDGSIPCGDEVGIGWAYDGGFHAPPPSDPEPVNLTAYAAQKRWEKEVGGALWNGWPVHTDRESQSKIVAERLAIEAGVRSDPDAWKFADGEFRMVSNEDFIALTNTVRNHVRQCFAIEAAVLVGIAAEQITTIEQVDEAFE